MISPNEPKQAVQDLLDKTKDTFLNAKDQAFGADQNVQNKLQKYDNWRITFKSGHGKRQVKLYPITEQGEKYSQVPSIKIQGNYGTKVKLGCMEKMKVLCFASKSEEYWQNYGGDKDDKGFPYLQKNSQYVALTGWENPFPWVLGCLTPVLRDQARTLHDRSNGDKELASVYLPRKQPKFCIVSVIDSFAGFKISQPQCSKEAIIQKIFPLCYAHKICKETHYDLTFQDESNEKIVLLKTKEISGGFPYKIHWVINFPGNMKVDRRMEIINAITFANDKI